MTLKKYPILALRQSTIFPSNVVPFKVGRSASLNLAKDVASIREEEGRDLLVTFLTQKNSQEDYPKQGDLYPIGVVGRLLKVVAEAENYKIVVEGIKRVRMVDYDDGNEEDYAWGEFEDYPWEDGDAIVVEALYQNLKDITLQMHQETGDFPKEIEKYLESQLNSPSKLGFFIAGNLDLPSEEFMELLETDTFEDFLRLLNEKLYQRIEMHKTSVEIRTAMQDEMERSQQEWALKQQMKVIQKKLGEESVGDELEQKVLEADLPEEVSETCMKQIKRLRGMQSSSSEYAVTQNYIETLLSVPWNIESDDNMDLVDAQNVLDADHHGLAKVKTRLIEFLAVKKLTQSMSGPILCLEGPPGVGKSSIAKSVARALNRKFCRISLGGVHDESEIRGHRRTYVGSMPGRLAKALIKAGTNNPVILLDEIDKIGRDHRGDPQAALLEVLDPEQNDSFGDHYLDLPLDLSNVLFIATANQLEGISGPLRDRMEIINVPSYTTSEKKMIARKHLFPRQIKSHGISEDHVEFPEDLMTFVVENYTREAGVRNLERRIAEICRAVAVKVALLPEEDREEFHEKLTQDFIVEKLGPEKHSKQMAQRTSVPGVSTGLAWTAVGGDILFVEASKMPGSGRLKLTGQIGDVMRESCEAAVSFIRANAHLYGISKEAFEDFDLHVHFPAGAIPKDGPSAGVTIFSAIISILTGINVDKDVAMTGEISLRGAILPVGGIKEKLTAAHRAGIKRVIIPKQCEKDLVDLADEVRKDLEIIPLDRVDELPEHVLEDTLPTLPMTNLEMSEAEAN